MMRIPVWAGGIRFEFVLDINTKKVTFVSATATEIPSRIRNYAEGIAKKILKEKVKREKRNRNKKMEQLELL